MIVHRRPNRLREKVGGTRHSGAGTVPVTALERANEVYAEYAALYPDQAKIDLSHFLVCYAAIQENPATCAEAIAELRECVREMLGLGGMFGFPLLTDFGRSLYNFIGDNRQGFTERQMAVLKAHADAITLVVRQEVNGEGGDIGKALKSALGIAIRKFAAAG